MTIAAGALWVPYLQSFPLMLIITTIVSIALSYLVSKCGPLRYFIGVPPPRDSSLPGKRLGGFVPVLLLSGLAVLQCAMTNLL